VLNVIAQALDLSIAQDTDGTWQIGK
jgi:hypothetical protein